MIESIPIRMHRALPSKYKTVEWKIHNVCNYNCSFCHVSNKAGDQYWFPLEKYKDFAQRIMLQAEEEGKFIWFQITGGEPTLYPRLIELLEFIKASGHKVAILTNGSRTIRYWSELAEKNIPDILFLTHHTEQSENENHMLDVVSVFQNTSVDIRINVTAPKPIFDEGLRRHLRFVEETGGISTLKPIFSEAASTDRLLSDYTPEQLKILLENSSRRGKLYNSRNIVPLLPHEHFGTKMHVKFNDNTSREISVFELASRSMNNFKGWQCSIGMDMITIQHDIIYRGVCRMGGIMGTIDDVDFKFSSEPIVCKSSRCTCLMDLQEPRWKV